MPCYEPGPTRDEERQDRMGLTAGLCVASETLDALGVLPASLRAWYVAHREADSARDELQLASQQLESKAAPLKARNLALAMTDPLWEAVSRAERRQCVVEKTEHEEWVKLANLRLPTTAFDPSADRLPDPPGC